MIVCTPEQYLPKYFGVKYAYIKAGAKTFPGHAYPRSKDGTAWLWHFLVKLNLSSSKLYLATDQSQNLMVIGSLNTLCHSCWFACQQRELVQGRDSLTMVSLGKFGSILILLIWTFIHICVCVYIHLVFMYIWYSFWAKKFPFHIERWPEWDLNPRPLAYWAHALTNDLSDQTLRCA